jgi:hypothetical protein
MIDQRVNLGYTEAQMTKKAKIINQLDTLSATQKETTIAFFSKYPVFENRIDWNIKALTYSDFEKVFLMVDESHKTQKTKIKENPELLFKGHHCRIVSRTEDFIIAMPLDWECAVFFNSFNSGGKGAKWCIGYKSTYQFWNDSIDTGNVFYLVFFIKKHPVYGKKVMIKYHLGDTEFSIWEGKDERCTNEFLREEDELEEQDKSWRRRIHEMQNELERKLRE